MGTFMIRFTEGDIFGSSCECLVNPVNCVGVMGGGLAALFKEKFPISCEAFNTYSKEFYQKNPAYSPGNILFPPMIYGPEKGKRIMMFPTKRHWKNPSELDYIKGNVKAVVENFISLREPYPNIKSIAFPKLGSGLGGLRWASVKTVLLMQLEKLNEIEIEIYE